MKSYQLGAWQKQVLRDLANRPHNPLRELRGTAKNWSGRYRQSLVGLEEQGLIESGPYGPRGGLVYRLTTLGKEVVQNA